MWIADWVVSLDTLTFTRGEAARPFMTRHTLLLFCLLAALSSVSAAEKERLVFQPGAITPDAPMATPTPSSKNAESPTEKIELFFLALKANQVSAAYDALIRNTPIAGRPDEVAALKERSEKAIDQFGAIAGYEIIDESAIGTHLLRRTAISLNTDLPLCWRFYFYRAGGEWRLVDLRVDDGIAKLFEDFGQSRK